MAKINVTQGTAGAYGAGELQLENKVQMTATLTPVTDNLNTASPLKLSTNLVQTTSTLKITTADNPYIDAEDNSGNNRFTVGRDPASQQVNVDFASNPTGSTTAVGAIRTYQDGVNLSEAMTFREDGNVGINTNTPGSKLDVHSAANVITQFNRTGTGKSWIQYLLAGAAKWSTGNDNTNGNYTVYDSVNSVDRMVVTNAGNVGIGTTTPARKLNIVSADAQIRIADPTSPNTNYWEIASAFSNTNQDFFITNQSGNAMVINASRNVGIGTNTPNVKLEVSSSAVTVARFNSTYGTMGVNFANSSVDFGVIGSGNNVTPTALSDDLGIGTSGLNKSIVFATGTSFTERGRFTSDGYLRLATTSGGIQFNGDTAAANALNDYEEGTWTMGISFGGNAVGVTYSVNTGKYTKIGRQVTLNGILSLSSKGSSTGTSRITGLPFVIGSTSGNYSAPTLRFNGVTFINQFQGYGAIGDVVMIMEQITNLGATTSLTDTNFANNSDIIVSMTYFV
jgi:hypothetical protein